MDDLKMTEVLVDDIGEPGDGRWLENEGLYDVPIRLNRNFVPPESRLLRDAWTGQPLRTRMRPAPGLTLGDDRVIITNTTIEDIEQYYAAALKKMLQEVNEQAKADRAEEERLQSEREAKSAAHRAHVQDAAKRIEF